MPVSLGSSSSCDVCSEDFSPERAPHCLPCGHLMCLQCGDGILNHAVTAKVCPYCRAAFTRSNIRKLHIDFGGEPARGASRERHTALAVAPPQAGSSFRSVHGAFCDLCTSEVVGDRYKCTNCPDFDTCGNCFSIVAEVHPGHTFVRVRNSQDYIRSGTAHAPTPHHCECTECNRPIVGAKYTCTHPNCARVIICENCEAHPLSSHPRTHALVKHRLPIAHTFPTGGANGRAPAHPARCDGCAQAIYGVRYKCFHRLCPDFDLCAACEADPMPRHPVDHPMLKVKVPSTPIPNMQPFGGFM